MTRTNAREIAMHLTFELAFSSHNAEDLLRLRMNKEYFALMREETFLYHQFPNKKQGDYIEKLVSGAFLHSPELDDYISRYAKGWRFSRIPKVATALMRIAMFEILYMPDIPNSVAINDALEICKGYDEPEVISFMNGILGTFLRSEVEASPLNDFKEDVFDLEETVPEEIAQADSEAESQGDSEEDTEVDSPENSPENPEATAN